MELDYSAMADVAIVACRSTGVSMTGKVAGSIAAAGSEC
ncbi:MAG: hypothetical protein OFPI_36040 [Osedax symbiont Rs2]|nr:MAG: hypothetical protein OFPI_36040 [Osedax symbiont Rs2]